MTVSAVSGSSGGEVKAVFPVETGSIPGRIAINAQYLIDYFADKSGMVTMGKSTNTGAPLLFHYGSKPIVAVMPMQVQWPDDTPETEESKEEVSDSEVEGVEEPEKEAEEENAEEQVAVEVAATGPATETTEASEKPKHRGRKKKST